MEIYVDFLGSDDRYRARAASFVAPSLPLAVLRAAAAIEAPEPLRVFHVEGTQYVDDRTVAEAGIRERDSLVMVGAVAGAFPAPSELRVRWSAAGGVARRLAVVGGSLAPRPVGPTSTGRLVGFFEGDAR